jgi:hypothetical protein
MANFRAYQSRRLVDLQRKLNAIFVRKRDKGENIECIYRNLQVVERELSARRIF